MIRSYKYRLYPTHSQETLLSKHFGAVRFIYNLALETKKLAWDTHKVNLSAYDLIRQITNLKDDEGWLREVSSASLQQSVLKLGRSYDMFFKGAGFPKFKNKHSAQSFVTNGSINIDFIGGVLGFSKFQKGNGIKCVFDREFDGKIKNVTISKTKTGKYYASILVASIQVPVKKKVPKEDTAIGIDLGIKDFAVTSDGEVIANPHFLKNNIERLKVLQRRASRKQKGSANRAKANLRVARYHEKIGFKRNDFLHKLSKRLITENQGGTICLETLNIKGMVKNHTLSQAISDVSWSEFVRQLKYKGDWYGVNIIQIDRFAPSSKMCTCGQINKDLTLKDRCWICNRCGTTHNRDLLAASNIKKFAFAGLNYSGQDMSGGPVEQSTVVDAMKQEKLLTN